MSNNVKIIKLTSGEELLTNVVNESSEGVEIKDTLAVVMQPGQPGQPKIGFAFLPWGSLVDEGERIVLKNSVIAFGPVTPVKEVVAHYNSVFSPISLPPQNLVIAK